jgi:hypothetical protein
MVSTKKKKTNGRVSLPSAKSKAVKRSRISGSKVHVKRAKSSGHLGLSDRDRRIFAISRWVILGVVIIAMLIVGLVMLFSFLNNTEAIVTGKIENITADYYENYFYPRIEKYSAEGKELADVMAPYAETGFSKVTLRQLLLFDSERYSASADYLTEHCSPESTYVKIYPEEPFGKLNYHVEYHYACTF